MPPDLKPRLREVKRSVRVPTQAVAWLVGGRGRVRTQEAKGLPSFKRRACCWVAASQAHCSVNYVPQTRGFFPLKSSPQPEREFGDTRQGAGREGRWKQGGGWRKWA